MDRRTLLCGLMAGTFILTFAFLSWHDRRHDAAPVTRVAPQPHINSLVSKGATVTNSRGPSSQAMAPTIAAAPAVTAMTPPEPVQGEPQGNPHATPDVDDGAMLVRGDRGAEHGSRSR